MSPPKKDKPSLFPEIAAAAKAAADADEEKAEQTRLSLLEQRFESIESLIEQLQASTKLPQKIADYVDNLQDEQIFFNKARYAVGFFAFAAVLLLATILGFSLFHSVSPLLKATPAVVAAFVLGIVSGMIFIVVSFIKGVFRSTVERHADGFLPPALDTLIKAADKLVGK